MPPRPRVALLSLGGTIASTAPAGERAVRPRLTPEELVAAVPGIAEVADIEASQLDQVPGSDVRWTTLLAAAREARWRIADGCAGVVVTQGTDTIEETATALDLLVGGEAPVVVTGAMRNPTLPGAEGPANLLAAVSVAASPAARGMGALVVLHDEIHAARYVRKTHTQSLSAFVSSPVGPVGWVSEGSPRIAFRPVSRSPVVEVPADDALPRIALVTVSQDDDGALLRHVAEEGYTALVVQAMGGGHVPERVVPALEALVTAMPVVLASRTGGGEVLGATYGFAGSESHLVGLGLMPAGVLPASKARVALALLLASGLSGDALRTTFTRVALPH